MLLYYVGMYANNGVYGANYYADEAIILKLSPNGETLHKSELILNASCENDHDSIT